MSITTLTEDFSRQFEDTKIGVKRFLHDNNPAQRERALELNGLEEALANSLEITHLPLVLNVEVDGREYVSIRRKELAALPEPYITESPDPLYRAHHFRIPTNLIPEDHIGVLVLPWTWGAMPKTKELAEILANDPDIMEGRMDACLLPHTLEALKRPYNFSEWQLGGKTGKGSKQIEVVKNVGGRYYSIGGLQSNIKSDLEHILMVRELKPDNEGHLWLGKQDQFWCEEEIKAQKDLNERFGRFYVVVPGSSEREKHQHINLALTQHPYFKV